MAPRLMEPDEVASAMSFEVSELCSLLRTIRAEVIAADSSTKTTANIIVRLVD